MTTIDRNKTEADIAALGPWFHNLRINGIDTAPDHFLGDFPSMKWAGFSHVLPDDLEGRSVLDIGCNAGFYALEMKRRNAGRVLGIDSDERYLAQARYAAEQYGVDIEYRQMSVYDLRQLNETFDLVLFMGVFYHLRHPLLALDLLHETVVGDKMLFQSLQRGSQQTAELAENYSFDEQALFDWPDFPKLHFVEQRYADDPTNWFIPNKAAVEAMLRSAGFSILENPEPEVFLVERSERYFAAEPAPHTG
ncbi:TIGR04290 family methyltransferase [Martelella sp. AMO21009]